MTKHVTAGDVFGAKLAKALFSYMNLQVNNFVRGTKATQTFSFERHCPRASLQVRA